MTAVVLIARSETQNLSKRNLYSERKQKLAGKNYLDQTLDQVKAISFHCYLIELPDEASYPDKIRNNSS